ncbi:MAG: hypothetical protein A3G39_01620 [Deltaproteobacteria bacterium RIFCSPLOWO2_12_FULL_43_16]|nr:MAG: hypothetical protein A2Z89_09515 [Deltaproteobacteria bacterium GWA2_43_19]OGQ09551.1 MAG: hypothetical protein A3D30_05025 [Deltaproteobacteria bacterium RIFCSPHIGHO2_02_FULL_43_33]OGQ58563.1 MAG: hypothetical protein A3G39_01620 [Deltaproteobacteria bacterium RIFCSPLOWO2_12_FULL_43_16]HBR18299.1 hypothetical protein [Deltaproteobacteria bacterium]
MKKVIAALAAAVIIFSGGMAFATPSTHIWSPSTDIQPYGVFHLTSDIYVTTKGQDQQVGGALGARPQTVTNLGFTVGVLPFEKVQLEVGFDHIAGYGTYDAYPIYYNAKLGIPEGAFGDFFPALAVGGYMLGTKTGGEARVNETAKLGTDYNILYAKAAKTIGPAGRFSVGYYKGNERLLVDENGKSDEAGILLCWERTMSEISDNLWLAIDYMGGDSSYGALSYGFSWKFAPNASVIFAYVDQNNDKLSAVEDWFTVQVDIDFDVFSGKKEK